MLLLGFPLAELLSAHVSSLRLALVLFGLAGFVVTYLALLFTVDGRLSCVVRLTRRWDPPRMAVESGLVVAMFCLAVAMTLGDRGGWASMFIYTAAVASMWMRFSSRVAAVAVFLCIVSATVLVAARGAGMGAILSIAATCAGVGFLMLSFGQLRLRNVQLLRARDELARLAVAEERLRFARDLHDLLGHSLSVIALKAELAGRLLERDVGEAATHVAELEQVARTALAEVREAASGYRRPALASELDGAKMALEAAGIATSLDRCEAKLAPEVEALLAWTVREGTTNVIRHSGARSCRVAIDPGLARASVEVVDDGPGIRDAGASGTLADDGPGIGDAGASGTLAAQPGGRTRGHGLDGLRERVHRLGGELEAGPTVDGGFQLRVTVPTAPAQAIDAVGGLWMLA
ncbi:MAG: sensor histidine kinase [Solirubrobacteraceae bacterium]